MPTRILFLLRTLTALSLVALVASLSWGQGAVTTGTLIGDVTDSSGAVLAGAKVTVINESTGIHRETVTDSGGHFVVSQLPAGKYEVAVSEPGFNEALVHDYPLNVDSTQTLKFSLKVGQVEQKVEVSAEAAAPVETTKTEVSNVIQEVQVRELPINQRSFTSLVTQEPGLVKMTNASGENTQTPTTVAWAQGSQISANGMVSQSMAYLVDGVNINNSGFGAPGTAAGGDVPGVEAIQEFKVLNHNYSAAYGGSAGAVVSFATRGGTNKFHGSVYEFLRNDKMDAREYFNTLTKNPYKRNQFGATFGGPIKKDRSFFFVNWEALRSRLTTTTIGNVPSDTARNGGVGGTSGFPVFDPWGNPTAISPGVQAILSLYPHANGPDFGNGIAEYIFPNYQPVNQQYGLARFDQVLSQKDTLSVRYNVTDANGFNAYFLPTFSFNKDSRLQGATAKWTRTISSNLVNTASVSFQRSLTNAVVNPTVPLPVAALTGNVSRGVVGTISVGSSTSGNTSGALSTIGLDNWGPFRGAHNTLPINDDLIYTHGTHTLKFGGQFVPNQWNWDKGNLIGGGWTFNSLNDLLAGQPGVLIILQDGANPHWKYYTKQVAWYVEDSWRMKRNLTLTMGLRHEFQTPVLGESHSPSRLGNVTTRNDPNNVVGTPYHNYTKKQFSPRVGIAWDPFGNGKTVIRTGAGLFYDMIPFEAVSGELSYNDPQPTLNTFFGITVVPPGFRGTPSNPTLPPIPFPACPAGANGTSACTVNTGFPGLLTGVLEKVRAPTSVQWNLQVERELPGQLKLAATYTGSQTANLMRGIEGNSSLPCSVTNGVPYFGATPGACGTAAPAILTKAFTLYAVTFDGHSFYNAGTLELRRRFANGISFAGTYTLAKGISDVDTNNSGAILLGNASHSEDPLDRHVDRSESMMSFRHRFTMNGIFELPYGRGHKWGGDWTGLRQALFGSWAFNTLLEARDGIPFSVLDGVGITNVGDNLTFPDRPNILRPNPILGGTSEYFDPLAYALQTPGFLGTAPRNSVRGPNFTEVDLSLTKNFRTSERTNLEFRAEAFNLINHPNFDIPANQLYTPTPALDASGNRVPNTNIDHCNLTAAQQHIYSCNPQAGLITRSVGTPRQMQLALKFIF